MPLRPGPWLRLAQSLGLASLILVMNYGELLGGAADARMHVPFGIAPVVLAQIADIFLLGLLIWAVVRPLESTRAYPALRLLLAMAIPPYLAERTEFLFPFEVKEGLLPILSLVWAVLVLVAAWKLARVYRGLRVAGNAAGVFLAIFAVFSVGQLLWAAGWKPGPQQRTAVWQHPAQMLAQSPRQHPLLVWIVFDELSYDQVFEHRAASLRLPNFDALRAESTVFTGVQPAGYKTVKILPSLLSGQQVEDFRFTRDNHLLIKPEDAPWHRLMGSGTVFADARRAGWRTAAVGWYNPYCTLYGDALDSCYFGNQDPMDGLMDQGSSVWANTVRPLGQLAGQVVAPARAAEAACTFDVRHRQATLQDLLSHSMEVLRTSQADFVFLHLPIPHSPNLWNRATDSFATGCGQSYLDNLALTDRVLGQVLGTLRQSPRWPETTLIVEGDHSWRIELWNWLPGWTEEDEAASRNTFDPRPALLIHRAGQTTPEVNKSAWPLLRIHAVVDSILRGSKDGMAP